MNEKWIMEIQIVNKDTGLLEWEPVNIPGSSLPYTYNDEDLAISVLNICYGSLPPKQRRIRQIT